MQASGGGVVFPAELIRKVELSGDEHDIVVQSYSIQNGWEAVVIYPDGHNHHHQAFTVVELLDKISKLLKQRYNITDFQFKAVPQALEASTIKIGETKYA